MSSYFSFFPSLLYANTAVTNIIAKAKFDASVSKNLAVFYPYTLQEGERADQLAELYYEDSSYDWIIYLSNGIVDPYHDWPKSENSLNDFITTKYGSSANAQLQTAYYRVNYTFDDRIISTATYAALSAGQKQYWGPILGYNDVVINYQRKEMDTTSETNQTLTLTGSFGGIVQNDIIKQSSTVMGTVGFANSSTLTMKHISGTWLPSTPVYEATTNALANASIAAVSSPTYAIPLDEISYWSSVSLYDVEQEKNEANKNIRLLSSSYINAIETDMRDLFAS